jgi:phenylacetate-CoA ligase
MTGAAAFEDRVRAYVAHLGETQFWPAERLRAHQEELLARLVVHAYTTVPFYAERLKPLFRRRFGPHLHKWDQVPVLTRADVVDNAAALRSTAVPPEHGRVTRTHSSGSTGMPVRCRITQLESYLWRAAGAREHAWHGRDRNLKLASVRSYLPGGASELEEPSWGVMASLLGFEGPAQAIDAALPIADIVGRLNRFGPDYLNAFAGVLHGIAQAVIDRPELHFPLKGIMSMAEPITEETRAICRAAWGLEVADRYGAKEVGPIANQCPDGPLYHVDSEIVRHELIGPHGAPVGPGEIGSVVLTPLHHYAMPMIRYAIGDHAVAGGDCGCGRGLPTIARIMGRTRNRFIRPDGDTYWPTVPPPRLVDIYPLRQFQYVQTALDAVTLRVVADRDPTDEECARIADLVREYLHTPLDVAVERVDEIARNAGGKYEDYLCRIEGDAAAAPAPPPAAS